MTPVEATLCWCFGFSCGFVAGGFLTLWFIHGAVS